MNKKKLVSYLLALVFVLGLFLVNAVLDRLPPALEEVVPTHAPTTQTDPTEKPTTPPTSAPTAAPTTAPTESPTLDEYGHYNSKEEVALYIHLYGKLPENYITKSECQDLGYSTSRAQYAVPDGAIGGDVFGNREGLLPKAPGRTWTECDIDTWDKNARGKKRIVFSNDGLIFYTDDHYESFEQLYGEE